MKIIAIANQKGGVGKTTTTINLGAALAEQGVRVLVIDLDPQGNTSTGLGISIEQRAETSYDLLHGGPELPEPLSSAFPARLDIIPATADLASSDIDLHGDARRVLRLRDALHSPRYTDRYDLILIDCPPSLSLLTVNAIVAADSVLIPLQAEFFALEGLSQLMVTIRDIRARANPGLRIEGIVMTMVDGRNRLAQNVEADVRETLGGLVFSNVIPRNVRIGEAPSFGHTVLEHDPSSKGAAAYRALAAEMLAAHHNRGLAGAGHDGYSG